MKKWISMILVLVILAAVPVCPAFAEDKTVLTMDIMNLTFDKIIPVIDAFTAQHPDVEIVVSNFRGANGSEYSTNELQHGNQADIYFTTKVEDKQEAMKANLIDLSAYPFLNDIVPSYVDMGNVDGGIYLLPITASVFGIWYNKTLLNELGFDLPQDYSDLVAIKAACDEKGIRFSGMDTRLPGGNFQYVIYTAVTDFLSTIKGKQWEKQFLAGEDVDFDIWDNTFAYLQKLIDIGFYCHDDNADGEKENRLLFYEGEMLFYIGSSALDISWSEKTGYEYGVMPYISEDGSNNVFWYTASQLVGLSKTLAEPGNEKRLEMGVAFVEYLFSPEGQALYSGGGSALLPMRKDGTVEPDSFMYDAYLASLDGRVVRQIYGSWSIPGLVIPVGDMFKAILAKQATMDDLENTMRDTMAAFISAGGVPIYGTVTEDLTLEQSAKVVGQVFGNMLGTDVAIMSLGGYHGEDKDNNAGVCGILYAGDFNQEDSWVPLPGRYSAIAKLKLTGAQIKELVEEGFDRFADGNPYPYVLVTRSGLTLEDNTVYEVAMAEGSYTDAVAEMGQVEIVTIDNFLNVYTETMGALSPISPDMEWN